MIGPPSLGDYGAASGSLSWSPDGRWLTMVALAPVGCAIRPAGCNQQVFAYRTDGSDLFSYPDPDRQIQNLPSRQVTRYKGDGTGPAGPAAPQFCGSSTRILYEAGHHAYLVDRDGAHRRRTALDTRHTGYPVCIPPPRGGGPARTVNVMHVTVPQVRTLSYAAAKRRLELAHLHVGSVKRVFSARIRRGHVVAEFPRADVRVHRSSKQGPPVELVLSRGGRPQGSSRSRG